MESTRRVALEVTRAKTLMSASSRLGSLYLFCSCFENFYAACYKDSDARRAVLTVGIFRRRSRRWAGIAPASVVDEHGAGEVVPVNRILAGIVVAVARSAFNWVNRYSFGHYRLLR